MNLALLWIMNRKRLVAAMPVATVRQMLMKRKNVLFKMSLIGHNVDPRPLTSSELGPSREQSLSRNYIIKL
jgi:hypothetical protein